MCLNFLIAESSDNRKVQNWIEWWWVLEEQKTVLGSILASQSDFLKVLVPSNSSLWKGDIGTEVPPSSPMGCCLAIQSAAISFVPPAEEHFLPALGWKQAGATSSEQNQKLQDVSVLGCFALPSLLFSPLPSHSLPSKTGFESWNLAFYFPKVKARFKQCPFLLVCYCI